MKNIYLLAGFILLLGCKKTTDRRLSHEPTGDGNVTSNPAQFSTFTIQKGAHYCDQNIIKSVSTAEMKFIVRFDNSAIYQTDDPENQYDINKLWGFSEDTDNHYNSARIGWSWNNEVLRLYGYAYANGILYYQEITPVAIGTDIMCSVKPESTRYFFTVNGVSVSLPRGPSTPQASGFQQYPFFGGDEVAPQLITILIKSL